MKTPRRTETPAAPPGVCSSCRKNPVRVVRFTDEQGKPATRASTSCADCQRAAFGGGSAPAAPAVVVETVSLNDRKRVAEIWDSVGGDEMALSADQIDEIKRIESAPISETRSAPRPVVPLTSDETITALAASVERVAAPPSVTAADLSRHAVRMRKAGMGPVTRETCDPHERRFFSVGGGR